MDTFLKRLEDGGMLFIYDGEGVRWYLEKGWEGYRVYSARMVNDLRIYPELTDALSYLLGKAGTWIGGEEG